ncbi:pentatricopeptide repeat-containing protein At5g15300 [Silene latifolia]|uniref:pentatricopeptide repeat-containing protein At5g15300 n=1 Tax=Silene latifolia TaxID=37657 RepID=UPI003D76CFFB
MIRKKKGLSPNNLTCSTSSNIWHKVTNLRTLKQMHAHLVINGFISKPSSTTDLIFASAITVFGAIDYAYRLFDQIPKPDTFLWNTMIRGSSQSHNPVKALYMYTQMDTNFIKPDTYTFPYVLKACTRLGWVNMGHGIHGRIVKLGFESNSSSRNSLIYFHATAGDIGIARDIFENAGKKDVIAWTAMTSGYARRGDMNNGRTLFDRMPVKDVVSWNVMITAYAKRGDMEKAGELFEQAPCKDVVTWNAMISGHVLQKSLKKAMEIYENMMCIGQVPDEITMLSLLAACADLGDLEVGKKIHGSILEMGPKELNIILGNALVDMYAKCGKIGVALQVFQSMKEKDISSWNSILGGLASHGYATEAVELFQQMKGEKIWCDGITFIAVLTACSHTGNVEQGRNYFKLMMDEYGIEPSIQHYGCMVDMLSRAGLVSEAFEFVKNMKMEPNAIIWRTLLGACKVNGDMGLGLMAYKELLERKRDQSGDYVLFSSISASVSKWDAVENVRNLMDDTGVRKECGCSHIEAN